MEKGRSNIKHEILTLILADMRNRKLLMGLDATGLSTDEFNTNLSELIFIKMGIEKQHEVLMCNWYETTIFDALDIDLNTFRQHQLFLSLTFYDALQEKNRKLQAGLLLKSKSTFSFSKWTTLRRCDN
jgi:hypothetical protein